MDAVTLQFFAGLLALIAVAGCERKSSVAIVLEKEYIPARGSIPPAPGPAMTAAPTTTPAQDSREMAPDEIAVDGIVMKPEMRGTIRDPRATTDEQWLGKVLTTGNGRTFNVFTNKTRFDKLRTGDRVRISYRVGKYTNSVWAADFE